VTTRHHDTELLKDIFSIFILPTLLIFSAGFRATYRPYEDEEKQQRSML
jgi:hypothetical protein